jgi:transcriptional regulator with XRE-family HTH domain
MSFTTSCPDCPFTTTNRTEGLAVYALKRHSCDRQRRLREKADRVAARRAKEGPKRDCQCKYAKHEHGTRTAYVVDRCKCRQCLDANSAAKRQVDKQKAYGRYDNGRVDAGPAREHVRNLMAQGMAWKQVAKVAGLSPSTVSNLLYGRYERGHAPYPRMSRVNSEKLLAVKVTLENLPAGHHVDATGTHRRLRALVAIGWSQSRLAALLGIERSNFTAFMRSEGVTVRYALAVRDLYDQIWDEPQEGHDHRSRIAANRARNYARERGWLPPLAWDDDTMDDPATLPDLGGKPKRRDTLPEDVEFLISTGENPDRAAARLGMKRSYLLSALRDLGRPDLAEALLTDTRTNARQARKAIA